MSWWSKALSFIANPIAEVVGSWNKRKEIAAQSAAKIAEAEVNLRVSKLNAKAAQVSRELEMDNDYDLQVLRNRNNSIADEFIIIVWFIVFLMHFSSITQPNMSAGWKAMGYTDGPAWWFEFGMVGILVSTLGLMRVLKLLVSRFRKPSLEAPEKKVLPSV